ncbi:MAG: phosphoglycerate kinase, partial [Chloroflexi bacterium]|nr:phosphoglycerate kinase [Chloroflexota bacterium]
MEDPARPLAAVLGGAKVHEKILVLENLLSKVDMLFIGGGMAVTFLKAQGHSTGASSIEEDKLDFASHILRRAGENNVPVFLPEDVVVASQFGASPSESKTVDVDQIPPDWYVMDIGERSAGKFVAELQKCKTVIWNGPHGTGSLQLFIHAEPRVTYFELREPHPQEVKRIAAFDLIANNADRKGGHCIKDLNGKVWGIDHGLTFSVEHKLRTVIWDFGGDPIPQETLDEIARELARFHIPGGLSHTLKGVLFDEEIESLALRMQEVLHNPVFPEIQARWDVPWPLI